MSDDHGHASGHGLGGHRGRRARPGRQPAGHRAGRRRGVTERQRPLWLLIPGGLLMTLIIVIPLLLAVYISLIDLDQYTLRRWLERAVHRPARTSSRRSSPGCRTSIWISVSFAVISTIGDRPVRGGRRDGHPEHATAAAPWSGRSS